MAERMRVTSLMKIDYSRQPQGQLDHVSEGGLPGPFIRGGRSGLAAGKPLEDLGHQLDGLVLVGLRLLGKVPPQAGPVRPPGLAGGWVLASRTPSSASSPRLWPPC